MSTFRKLAILLVFASWAPALFAQGGATGAISGIVQDQSGGWIAGAQVSVVSEATGQVVRDLTTDSSGSFTATLLPVGSYSVAVSASGFATTKFTGVLVRVTETTRMTAALKVTKATETVTVSAEVTTINTANAATGEALDSTTVSTLPLPTQNFQQLLSLSTGASSDINNGGDLGRGSARIVVNGQRETNNNYSIEGVSSADFASGELTFTPIPNANAIEEFKVSTSLYDATLGRNGGGNIDAVLKSGTNKYHADAWEYFRNTVLDANDFFLNGAGSPRPVIKQNIFGGDFGGPVTPDAKLGFFYVNYQGSRQRAGGSPGTLTNAINIPYVPLAARQSASALAAACGVPSVDPVALSILQAKSNQFGGGAGGYLYPLPTNVPATTACLAPVSLIVNTVGKYTENQFLVNWDRHFRGDKDSLAFRFFWSDSEKFQPFGADSFQVQTGGPANESNLNFPLTIPLRGRFGSVTETHVFNNRLANEFRFGVNVIRNDLLGQNPVTAAQVGITQPGGGSGIDRFQFGNFALGPFPGSGQFELSDSFIVEDTVSWTRGPHTFRFGGELDHTSMRRTLNVIGNPLVFFTPPSNPALTDFQNFLEGTPTFALGSGGAANHDYRLPAYAVFAQDDYKVTSRLTLNLGFRVEFVGAPYDTLCQIANIDTTLASAGQPFVYGSCVSRFKIPGFSGTLDRTLLRNNYATVPEPRIGFAYDIFGDHRTVVRGGYGIYANREDIGAVDNLSFDPPFLPVAVPSGVAPGSLACLFFQGQNCSNPALIPGPGVVSSAFVPVPSFFQGFTTAGCSAAGLPLAPTNDTTQAPCFSGNVPAFSGLAVPPHWIAATTQQWNLSVERDLGKNWFVSAGYVGTKGTHLRVTYNPNQANLASPQNPIKITDQNGQTFTITQNTAANAAARAPFQPLTPSGFEDFSPLANSIYHSMQLTVAHHFAGGLYLQSAYTYSKSIDEASTVSVAFVSIFNDQNNPRGSRGLSDFDHRHRSITSFVYDLPFYKGTGGIKERVLGGWQTTGVLTVQSGAPFSVVDSSGGSVFASDGGSPFTPGFAPGFNCGNAVTPGSNEARLNGFVKPAAFVKAPAFGSDGSTGFGDVPRNCFIGPHQANMDLSLGKTIRISEHQSVVFRTDFLNVTNHPSFANLPAPADMEHPTLDKNNVPIGVGQIVSTVGNPRFIQFSLKYSF
ncbi:MAG TPA: carboxypeptidase-like regulatory domain-containing protein [Candidatus Acidoferrum sp.]|nr:carboxypeptidase-like regulatory domain-containing protein [Candidatus Acidoferrum sp.]